MANINILPKVSIILPVHNAGQYLHKCIQSLLAQTLKEIEIIIVLDCPTDGSDKIAKSYADQDERIKIIENEKNLRTGLSRNKGMDAATGEYIGFCDHDDYVANDMFEKMYNAALSSSADVVISNIEFIDRHGNTIKTADYPMDLSENELKKHLLTVALQFHFKKNFNYGKYVWNTLFDGIFLNKHQLKFDDNKIIMGEDVLFLSKIYFFTNKVTHCNCTDRFYKHVWHSSNTASSYSYQNIELTINYIENLSHFLNEQEDAHHYKRDVAQGAVRILYTTFRREIRVKGIKASLKRIKEIRKNKIVHQTLSAFFKSGGWRYAFKHLSLTKFVFLHIIYF